MKRTSPSVLTESRSRGASRLGPASLIACGAVAFVTLLAPADAAGQQVSAGKPSATAPERHDRRSGSDWFDRGMDLLEDEKWDAAIAAFRNAIEAGHREEVASYNIACAYARKGDKEHAFEWLGKAEASGFAVGSSLDDSDLESLHTDARWNELKAKTRSSRAARNATKVKKAVARFDLLIAATPKNGRALYDVARELLSAGDYDRAARAFVAAAEAGRREGTALYNAACAKSLANQKDEAFALLQRSLDSGFDDPGQIREDEDLDALRADPRFKQILADADALSLEGFPSLGGHLLRSQKVAEAEEAAERIERYLKAHPGSGRAWSNLGTVHLAAEEDREAARAFRKAYDLGYRRPASMYNLACALARVKERDEAFAWLDKAIDAGATTASHLEEDDDLWSLRRDPRFRKAVAKAKAREGDD